LFVVCVVLFAFADFVVWMSLGMISTRTFWKEEKERTSRLPADLQQLRLATQNTLELVAFFLLDVTVHDTCRAMVQVMSPYMASHSAESKKCRSTAETAEWLAHEAGGGCFDPLQQAVEQISQLSFLQSCGLAVRGYLPGANLKLVGADHPAVIEQDRLASIVGRLTMNIARRGLNTALFYSRCYPQACFAALVPEQAAAVMEDMRCYNDMFKRRLTEAGGAWWRKAAERSAFSSKFCCKVFLWQARPRSQCLDLFGLLYFSEIGGAFVGMFSRVDFLGFSSTARPCFWA
jgi:hypothetical protein